MAGCYLTFNRVFAVSVLYLILGVSSDFSLGADDFYFTKVGGESAGGGRKTVLDGERRVSLECAVSDSRQIGFRWTLNGIPVLNTTRRHQIGSNLFFRRIEREDDIGDYSCVATNHSSRFSLTSPLISLNVDWISPGASVHLSSPEAVTDIRPGVDVVLKCKVEGNSDITYEWFRNGDPIDRSERVAIRGRRLHINAVTVQQAGTYSCKGKNDAGVSAPTGKFPLIIPDEKTPKIIKIPEDQIGKKNEPIRFDCVFEENTLIQWFFYDNGPLSNSSRYTLYPNGSLMIHRVRQTDEGVWKCLGSSLAFPEEEPQIYSLSLKIAYLQQLSINQLYFEPQQTLIPSSKFAVPENGDASVFCELPAGLPRPLLWWEGPNGKVISSETSAFSSPRTENSSTLIFQNVKADQQAKFTCIAENLEGITRTSFQLIVTTPPTISGNPRSTIAEEGETTSFMCQFRPEYPVSQIRWLRNRVPIHVPNRTNLGYHHHHPMTLAVGDQLPPQRVHSFPENGTLKIEGVQMSDAGDYTCEIKVPGHPPVESRPAQLFVTETLKFMPRPIDRKLELGSNSKIHCKASGSPPPVIKWIKEGQPFFQWPDHITDQNGILHFTGVQSSDRGKYSCVATSAQGIINTTIYVDVIVTPKFSILPQNPTEAAEGHSVMIHCQAIGDPLPTIQWDKNNVMNGFDRNRFQVMENGSLLVTEVVKEDDGRYGCTAGNSGGFKREEVRLVVKSNDQYYSESLDDAVMTRTVSITLSVAAGYMLLVVGLMMWCRYRQLRRKQAYLAEISKENGDAEMKDTGPLCNGNGNGSLLVANGHLIKPESCRESVKSDGETAKSSHSSTAGGGNKTASATASVTSHRSGFSQNSKRSTGSGLDKISFPRQDLQFVMLLGSGEFGEVFLAKAKNLRDDGSETGGESLVMVKALQTREETALFEYKREIDMYHKLCHENVTKLVRLCREMDPHYMIMEYSDWGDLKQFLLATRKDNPRKVPKPPPLTITQILQVISQVALGMEHLSNHRFTHKDLATRNCLISSGLRIKVSNPGLSRDTYSTEYYKSKNQVIPIRWLPQEAVIEDDYSTKSDVWSFAVLIWEVVHQAAMPLSHLTNDQIYSILERKEAHWSVSEMENLIPKGLQNLMSQCWDPCPRNRHSFSTIVIQLSEILKEGILMDK